MIIVCAGMSRSGSTLQYQLVKTVAERYLDGHGAGFIYPLTLEIPSTLIVKTELFRQKIADLHSAGKAKIVSVYRDPRDVTVSLNHFFESQDRNREATENWQPRKYTMDDAINIHLHDTMGWYMQWETIDHPKWKYENLYFNGWDNALCEICDYLGIPITQSEAIKICEEFSIEKNYKRQSEQELFIADKTTMLSKEHISPRKGMPGQWKHMLTDMQAHKIEYTYKEWMSNHGYY